METRNLLCKSVEWPKVAAKERSFSKEFAANMAKDIEIRGLLNAISVRPNPDKPDHYIGVAGRHRWYAVAKVLKQDLIEAKVLEGMTDDDACMATTVENLWRSELTKSQHLLAIKKWHADFAARNPETLVPGAAGGAARKAQIEAQKKEGEESDPPIEPHAGGDGASLSDPPPPARPVGFNELVAAATGKSKSAAKRDIRLAKMFSEDELETFAQMEVSQDDMAAIAKIDDKAKRSEVCALVASGMEPKEAITQVTGDPAPTGFRKGKASAQAGAAAKADVAPDLNDDEWFTMYCSDKAALLADPTRFKEDALLFRAVSSLRHSFRVKSKSSVQKAKSSANGGLFFWLVRRFLNISHPKDWFVCETCVGNGVVEGGGSCPKCYGGGYILKTEDVS